MEERGGGRQESGKMRKGAKWETVKGTFGLVEVAAAAARIAVAMHMQPPTRVAPIHIQARARARVPRGLGLEKMRAREHRLPSQTKRPGERERESSCILW